MSKEVNSKIFVYQWNELEEGFGEQREFFIECYGISKKGENVYLKISGFQPYFYIELPTEIENSDNIIRQLKYEIENNITKVKQNKPTFVNIERKRKLYYTHKEKKKVEDEIVKIDKLFPFLKANRQI